jgi:alpha/beta superfamily hydrolase
MKQISQDTHAPRAVAAVRSPDNLRGPAGRLESLYVPGRPDAPFAAIVAHPHPLFGGTMHNKVVYHAAKAFQHFGLPVLRFNFRGAGASEGRHDGGEGEQQDLSAALKWLKSQTELPVIAAGFSFGAWVTLRTCCSSSENAADIRGIVAIGLPIQAADRAYNYEFLSGCRLPALFVSGSLDEFGPIPLVAAAFAQAAAPSELAFIPGVDHFFQGTAGGLQQMQAVIRGWLETWFLAPVGGLEEPR